MTPMTEIRTAVPVVPTAADELKPYERTRPRANPAIDRPALDRSIAALERVLGR